MHILAAKDAPIAALIRKMPGRLFHVSCWNTQTGMVQHGSWFHGILRPLKSDISFDGKWMIYHATGSPRYAVWTGLCNPPRLKTLSYADVSDWGSMGGGGWWKDPKTLVVNRPAAALNFVESETIPFTIEDSADDAYREGLHVLVNRLLRDGYVWDNATTEHSFPYLEPADKKTETFTWRFSESHPALHLSINPNANAKKSESKFTFTLEGHEKFLREVDWATWDSLGQLLVSRAGTVERYANGKFRGDMAIQRLNFESLTPPKKPEASVEPSGEANREKPASEFIVTSGRLIDQDVIVLIVEAPDAAWKRSESRAIRDLAGDFALGDFKELPDLKEGTFKITPGFYLRQPTLAWAKPPVDWNALLTELDNGGVRTAAVDSLIRSVKDIADIRSWLAQNPTSNLRKIIAIDSNQ
jgi:hypothetical protein